MSDAIHGYAPSGGGEIYAEDIDPRMRQRWLDASFGEEADFRTRMKKIEEFALSGDVTRPHAKIAGRDVRVVHRIGDRYDVQVNDPFSRKAVTVVSHQYDSLGRRKATWTAWRRGDPQSVAKVFGIPFVSAFGDTPQRKPQDVADRERADAVTENYRRQGLEEQRKERLRTRALRYENWVSDPKKKWRIPPEIVGILKEMGKWK